MAELRLLRARQPELADAADMHLQLLELQVRIQGRVPLPWLELNAEMLTRHQAEGRPILRFEDIPLDLTDLRLMVRQTAEVLRRAGALDDADYQKVQTLGRDMTLVTVVGQWFRSAAEQHMVATVGLTGVSAQPPGDSMIPQVLGLAMRPFLSRCAEVLQLRTDLAIWTHPYCALCGGEPDFSVITPAAERHLICSRCSLRWKFEPLTCPYCLNSNRAQHHVVRDARRPVSGLWLRRLSPLPQDLRCAPKQPARDAGRGQRGDAAARRGRHAAGLLERILMCDRGGLAAKNSPRR